MTDIYRQHEAAFARVSAFVVLAPAYYAKQPDRIATIAFKFPRDGAGRLYCYAHVIGAPMTRGWANGYGYDKLSAACESAFERMKPGEATAETIAHLRRMQAALSGDHGRDWSDRLRDAGYFVLQAV